MSIVRASVILLHVVTMPVNGGKKKDSKYQAESWVFIMTNAPGEFFFCSTPLLIISSLVQDKCGCVFISHFLTHFPVDVDSKISPESAYYNYCL